MGGGRWAVGGGRWAVGGGSGRWAVGGGRWAVGQLRERPLSQGLLVPLNGSFEGLLKGSFTGVSMKREMRVVYSLGVEVWGSGLKVLN